MTISINLLKETPSKRANLVKVKKTISVSLGFAVLVVLALFAGVYIYWYSLSTQTKKLENDIASYRKEIASYKDIEQKKSIINEKLSKIKNILGDRADFVKGLENLQAIMPSGITSKNLSLEKSGTTKMKVIASSSGEIEKFVNNIKDMHARGLSSAKLVSLTLDKGAYNVELNLEIPKKENK